MNFGVLSIKILCFGLNEPEKEEIKRQEIEKVYDYEEDIETLGRKLDKINRDKFSKEELDSIYITSTKTLKDINNLNEKENFEESINELKEEALRTEMLFTSEDFNIFGGLTEDQTKINTLGNTKHREIEKNKFRILDITKNTTNEQYISRLKEITEALDTALDKSEFGFKLKVFYASVLPIANKGYNIFHINPKIALEDVKDYEKINLYNIKLNEKTKGIALTNIAYYDNNNKTLPLGIDVSDKIVLDMSKVKLELKKQKLFRINQEIDEMKVRTKIICVYEYELV